MLPYDEARLIARKLKLRSSTEWRAWARQRSLRNLPVFPEFAYRGRGWTGWSDWLGYVAPEYKTFTEARTFARTLQLVSMEDWRRWIATGKKPKDIPPNPADFYRNLGWASWGDWLGTGAVATFKREYRSFNAAREFVRPLGLRSGESWWRWAMSGARPPDIPAKPSQVYSKKWKGWSDFLATGRYYPRRKRRRRP
jgi:hypothetical protein